MGCVLSSRIEEEDTVRRCKERRRLAKQLLSCRAELAAAQLAYLRSLRNTGATLRQFAEVELMMMPHCNPPLSPTLPPSRPLPAAAALPPPQPLPSPQF
ncbi:hypothetical protein ACMD2_08861 [Ananas comosus]|uniref:DUF630 domain-containing protein n=1 Tax=Ananas comosus TaxID=4615 RepID=A0A199VXY0_ANACO|nr:hypothetical protein ACMD2_08861 [Ananas comosus]